MIDLSVYLITDAALCARAGLIETVAAALRGGATAVQLRDKQASDAALIEQGKAIKALLSDTHAHVPLIVNDRLKVAVAIGADGLHLGQSDGDVAEARAVLGAEAILGLSVQSREQLKAPELSLVDYLGVGPVFATATKPDHSSPLGFDGLAAICAESPLPVVAIGGLSAEHAASIWSAGGVGMALVSAICTASDPERATREIAEACKVARLGSADANSLYRL
jgi:thiamine-phosphate pyrophosphorylase